MLTKEADGGKYSGGGLAPVSGRCGAQAVSGSLEGDQGGGSHWINNGKHGGAVAMKGRRRKKGRSTEGAPFITSGDGWQRRHELRAEWWRW
jgi:hypothetical protein